MTKRKISFSLPSALMSVVLVFAGGIDSRGQDFPIPLRISSMMRIIASATIAHAPEDDVTIAIAPHPQASMVKQIFSEVFLSGSKKIYRDSTTASVMVVLDLREVTQQEEKISDSTSVIHSRVQIGVTIEKNVNKMITWSHEFLETHSDTISHAIVFAAPQSANADANESFFEKIAEPILVTLTAIVIVVLFFTIRGS